MTYAVITRIRDNHIVCVLDPEDVFVEDSYDGFRVDFVQRVDDNSELDIVLAEMK